MSIINKIIIFIFLISLNSISIGSSEEIKKIGKFKDWETLVLVDQSGNVCFAQSAPVLQAPK